MFVVLSSRPAELATLHLAGMHSVDELDPWPILVNLDFPLDLTYPKPNICFSFTNLFQLPCQWPLVSNLLATGFFSFLRQGFTVQFRLT